MENLFSKKQIEQLCRGWREQNKTVVFTNGCFDILHRGHVAYLNEAKALGDVLVVGLNSDESVRKLKGEPRPFMPEEDRAYLLLNLRAVDAVVLFSEDTPDDLIKHVLPDILVKGGDYIPEEIVGWDTVTAHGGKVVTIPLVQGKSTTNLVQKFLSYKKFKEL